MPTTEKTKTKRSRVRISRPAKKADTTAKKPAKAAKKASAKEMVADTAAKAKPAKKEKAKRPQHEGLNLTYAGTSKVLNRGSTDAKTAIRVRPSNKYTERVQSLVADMAATYGGKPFARYNAGAGALGRAIFLGCIEYVDGADSITQNEDGDVYHGRNARFKIVNPKAPHKPAHEMLANLR